MHDTILYYYTIRFVKLAKVSRCFAQPPFVYVYHMLCVLSLCQCLTICSACYLIQDKTSPLWIACQMGHNDVVKLLLHAGASIDQCRKVR